MALEFENVADQIEEMARKTRSRKQEQNELLAEFLTKLHDHALDWERLEHCLSLVASKVDRKKLRAARPLDTLEPIDAAVDPALAPLQATIVASDGSQIVPDRHAPYLYSLINVGIIIYFHGQERGPIQYAVADLDYPGKWSSASDPFPVSQFAESGAIVSLRRDRAEIEALAEVIGRNQGEKGPYLALLDQRLLYWPVAGAGDDGTKEVVLIAWQESMTSIRRSGGLLAGYIVRPRKRSVINLLKALDVEDPDFNPHSIIEKDGDYGLTDAMLFSHILGPGQRSKVFLDVSQHNDDFRRRDPLNEVCFFYLNPGRRGRQIARVDLPLWVAKDHKTVNEVHALIHDQCQILGAYPYVLARADEVAVVGRRDQENLELMIENAMERQGIKAMPTAKRSSKEVARAGRTRHEI